MDGVVAQDLVAYRPHGQIEINLPAEFGSGSASDAEVLVRPNHPLPRCQRLQLPTSPPSRVLGWARGELETLAVEKLR